MGEQMEHEMETGIRSDVVAHRNFGHQRITNATPARENQM